MSAKSPVQRHQSGFTPVPHSYFTVLGRKTSGYAQFFAIGYILDRTIGVPDKPVWAKLSCPTLARLTGLDAKSFELALEDAADRALVERRRVNCDGTCAMNACECSGRDWVYRALPDRWAAAVDWQRKKLAKDDEPAADEAQDEGTEDASAPRGDTLLVLPGKNSRPMLLSVAIKGQAEPIPMQLRYRNEVEQPFNVNACVKGDVITVTVRPGENASTAEPAKKRTDGEALRTPLRNRETPPEQDQRFTDFKSYLNITCLRHFHKAADAQLVASVLEAAGDASVEEYAMLVDARLQRRGNHKSGLLINLAADAAAKRREDARLAKAAEPTGHDHDAWLRRMRAAYGDDAAARDDLKSIDPTLYSELFGSHAQGD